MIYDSCLYIYIIISISNQHHSTPQSLRRSLKQNPGAVEKEFMDTNVQVPKMEVLNYVSSM